MLITTNFEMYRSLVKLPDECGHLLTIQNGSVALNEWYLLKSDLHSMNMYVGMYVK